MKLDFGRGNPEVPTPSTTLFSRTTIANFSSASQVYEYNDTKALTVWEK